MKFSDSCKVQVLTSASADNLHIALNRKARVPYYRFANMKDQPGLVHGVFTRQGGRSRGPFNALNVGLGIGDEPDAVAENRRRVAACLGVDRLVFINQVHQDGIVVVQEGDRFVRTGPLHEKRTGDAMITDVPGICLAIQVADCQAVVLYDPDRRVVANIHSGWRSSIVNIIGKTVDTMAAKFGCDPENLLAGVSPSLGPCCAEFVNFKHEIPKKFWPYRVSRDHFDFWEISRDQLIQAGVLDKNLENSGCCTCCHPERFYSYRAEQVTGRFVVAAGLSG